MKACAAFIAMALVAVAVAKDDGNNTNETEVYVAPTEAPTPAPSPAPYVAPTEAPTPAPSPAPSPAPVTKKTHFSMSAKLESLDDFNANDFVKGLASAMGIDSKNVELSETFFELSSELTFTAPVAKSAAIKAIATAHNLSEKHVTVTMSSRRLSERMLGGHEGTEVDATVMVPTTEKAKAAELVSKLGSSDGLASMASALGIDASTIEATKVVIGVTAKVTATTTNVVSIRPPTTQQLIDGLKAAAPSKTFDVTAIGDAEILVGNQTFAPTSAPTSAPTAAPTAVEDEEDGAFGADSPLARIVLAAAAAMAMNMAAF